MSAQKIAVAALAPLLLAAQPGGDLGTWRNPQNSVHIHVHPCGDGALCGTVVWANDKAKADAKRGGTDPLVGTDLFRQFRAAGPKLWRGKVFVPDLNRTFSGTVTANGDGTITGRGCLLGNIGCKSQTWTRVE